MTIDGALDPDAADGALDRLNKLASQSNATEELSASLHVPVQAAKPPDRIVQILLPPGIPPRAPPPPPHPGGSQSNGTMASEPSDLTDHGESELNRSLLYAVIGVAVFALGLLLLVIATCRRLRVRSLSVKWSDLSSTIAQAVSTHRTRVGGATTTSHANESPICLSALCTCRPLTCRSPGAL